MENKTGMVTLEINLNAAKEGTIIDESWLRMFGTGIKSLLGAMFGGSEIPVAIKGTKSQVESFANTLDKEKRYMSAWKNYGLDNPKTYKSKAQLDQAISKFERITNLNYPFK